MPTENLRYQSSKCLLLPAGNLPAVIMRCVVVALLSLFYLPVVGDTFSPADFLALLHSQVRLLPGCGIGRSPQQCLQEGSGNALEITCTAQAMLREYGMTAELMQGLVSLSQEQQQIWQRLPKQARGLILENCSLTAKNIGDLRDHETVLPWLRVSMPWLPRLGMAVTKEMSPATSQWVQIFPALQAIAGKAGDAPAIDAATGRLWLATMAASIQWEPQSKEQHIDGKCVHFPYQYLQQKLHQVYGAQTLRLNSDKEEKLIFNDIAFPGYHLVSPLSLQPVEIVEVAPISAAVLNSHQVEVVVTISDQEGIILQAVFPQEMFFQSALVLTWEEDLPADTVAESVACYLQAGDQVALRRVRPTMALGQFPVVRSESTRNIGTELMVSLARRLQNGALETDYLTARLQAGATSVMSVSSGSMSMAAASQAAAEIIDPETSALLMLAGSLRCRLDQQLRLLSDCTQVPLCTNLQAVICSREATFHRLYGQPLTVKALKLVAEPFSNSGVCSWQPTDDILPESVSQLTFLSHLLQLFAVESQLSEVIGGMPLSPFSSMTDALLQSGPLWLGQTEVLLPGWLSSFLVPADSQLYCLQGPIELSEESLTAQTVCFADDRWHSWMFANDDRAIAYYNGAAASWPETEQWRQWQESASAQQMMSTRHAENQLMTTALSVWKTLNSEAEDFLGKAEQDLLTLALVADLRQRRTTMPTILLLASDDDFYGQERQSCSIELVTERAECWELLLFDEQNNQILRQVGIDDEVVINWDFADELTDGSYRVQAKAMTDKLTVMAEIVICRDETPPIINMETTARKNQAEIELQVQLAVDDITEVNLDLQLLDETGHIVAPKKSCLWEPKSETAQHHQFTLPVEASGIFYLVAEAIDQAGNETCQQKKIILPEDVTTPAVTSQGLLIYLPGLSDKHRIIADNAIMQVEMPSQQSCHGLKILLDGVVLQEIADQHLPWQGQLSVANMTEGRHVLQAKVCLADNQEIVSPEYVFFYSRLAADFVAPVIFLSAVGGLPLTTDLQLLISAWDNQTMQTLQLADAFGASLASVSAIEPSQALHMEQFSCSAALLSSGLLVTAIDSRGNVASREIKYPLPASGKAPTVELTCEWLTEGTVREKATLQAVAHGDLPLAGIKVCLNGVERYQELFPESGYFVFTVLEAELRAGNNEFTVQVWDCAGRESPVISHILRTDVFRNVLCQPNPVRPWAGTSDEITVTAELQEELSWQVELLNGERAVLQSIAGAGKHIQARFSVGDLADGIYCLRFLIPELSAELLREIEVDLIRGVPLAEVTYPEAGAVVQEGILRVLGSACTSENDHDVVYALELWNDFGKQVSLQQGSSNGENFYTAIPMAEAGTVVAGKREWCHRSVVDGCLAVLDLSSVPDGCWRLCLLVQHAGQLMMAETKFTLQSQLKVAQVAFSEEDLRVALSGQELLLQRYYCSQNSHDDGLGPGWTMTLTAMQPVIDDLRAPMEDISGQSYSIRYGGSRDVTVTLPDGRRVTFIFSLREGGSWSFCYHAVWEAPPDIKATLTPLVDDRLMTLPGLQPYWAAAGPMTPWENYDFPGYVLTDQKGVQYYLTREKLGEAELLGNGQDDLNMMAGESAMVDVYGDLQLSQIVFPEGQQLQISDTGVQSCQQDGSWEDILRLENDPLTGSRLAVTRLGREPMHIAYLYDGKGNLHQVLQGEDSQQLRLKRRYDYEMPMFPHLLTSVQDGTGRTLLAFDYDDKGRLRKTVGADGAGSELYAQPAAGYAVVADATGRETVFLHDDQGRVNAKIDPGGERTTYEYDQQGREIAVINPLGHVTRKSYDEQGNMTLRTDANGQITVYERLADGKCKAIVDPAGRRMEYEYDNQGRVTTVETVTGLKLKREYDELGRPITITGIDGETVQIEYGSQGLMTAANSADGTRLEWDYNEKNLPAGMILSYFHPQNETLLEMAMFWDHDEAGKVRQIADSLGHWRNYTYDASGKVNVITTDYGAWQRRHHDAAGRLVEQWDQHGEVQRFVYDAAGRMLAHAYGAIMQRDNQEKPPPAVMIFPLICQYDYDQSGNQTTEVISTQGCVEREDLAHGLYRCHLLQAGIEEQRQQFYYDAAGRLIHEESATGCRRSYQLDAEGRTIATLLPDGATWKYTYGKLGEMLSIVDPLGKVTGFAYDQHGFLSARYNCDQSRREYVYDRQGRMIAEIDELGNCWEVERDSFGLPKRYLLPPLGKAKTMPGQAAALTAAYNFSYHDGKAMVGFTDPLGRQTQFQRDEIGRLTGEILPAGQSNQIFYADHGLLPAKQRNLNGQWTYFEYAQHQLLTRKICCEDETPESAQREYSFTYDARQKLKQIIRLEIDHASGNAQEDIMAWNYDLFDRVQRRQAGERCWVEWQHDGDGRRRKIETETTHCNFIYDNDGQYVQIAVSKAPGKIDGTSEDYLWQYDQRGLPVAAHLPDGGEIGLQWHDRGFPIRLQCLGKHGDLLYDNQTEMDMTGKVTGRHRLRRQNDGSLTARSQFFTYDAWGRLEQEESFSEENPHLCYIQEVTYDLVGNRLAVERNYDNGNFLHRSFQYDDNDRLRKERRETADGIAERNLFWDDNGSLLSVESLGQEKRQWQFHWDCESRLTAVTIVDFNAQGQMQQERQLSMSYDAQGMLCRQEMRKITATGHDSHRMFQFLWDEPLAGCEPRLLETVEYRNGIEYEHCFWLWSHVLMAVYSSRFGWQRCLSDCHGQVAGWWDPAAQQLSSSRDYDAWGEVLAGSLASGLAFAGEWQEPETGLLYLRSRFYWPEMGIFISRDTCPGNPEKPLSLHRYTYCQNDPVNNQDPSGCFSVSAIMSAMNPKNYCLPMKIWRGGVNFLAQQLCSTAMTLDFSEQPIEHDQATIVVHGLQYHAPGYADDFIDLLSNRGVEHDWYQFIWSGCQLSSVLLPPNIYFHSFALASLSHSLALLPGKGYSRLNVIAHSWGTVLTRDALRSNPQNVRHWVTMGSPLSSGTPLPAANISWMNIVTHSDPVVHLAPLLQALGFVDGVLPLYMQKSPPITVDLGAQSTGPHEVYWHHPIGIARIAALLKE